MEEAVSMAAAGGQDLRPSFEGLWQHEDWRLLFRRCQDDWTVKAWRGGKGWRGGPWKAHIDEGTIKFAGYVASMVGGQKIIVKQPPASRGCAHGRVGQVMEGFPETFSAEEERSPDGPIRRRLEDTSQRAAVASPDGRWASPAPVPPPPRGRSQSSPPGPRDASSPPSKRARSSPPHPKREREAYEKQVRQSASEDPPLPTPVSPPPRPPPPPASDRTREVERVAATRVFAQEQSRLKDEMQAELQQRVLQEHHRLKDEMQADMQQRVQQEESRLRGEMQAELQQRVLQGESRLRGE
eukprot:Hpha_TRINITY_DN15718_c4_g1::TRINITY_DN15718_c4_g1_i1::g.41460::m.41460/K01764/HCCS; cytochrome c heme-lyase